MYQKYLYFFYAIHILLLTIFFRRSNFMKFKGIFNEYFCFDKYVILIIIEILFNILYF